jgi:hypothetical protein
MVRNSLNFVPWKMQQEVAADLKTIYTSSTVELAEQMLGAFEARWDKDYPSIGQSWRRNWARVIPFFDYPLRSALFIPPGYQVSCKVPNTLFYGELKVKPGSKHSVMRSKPPCPVSTAGLRGHLP